MAGRLIDVQKPGQDVVSSIPSDDAHLPCLCPELDVEPAGLLWTDCRVWEEELIVSPALRCLRRRRCFFVFTLLALALLVQSGGSSHLSGERGRGFALLSPRADEENPKPETGGVVQRAWDSEGFEQSAKLSDTAENPRTCAEETFFRRADW